MVSVATALFNVGGSVAKARVTLAFAASTACAFTGRLALKQNKKVASHRHCPESVCANRLAKDFAMFTATIHPSLILTSLL